MRHLLIWQIHAMRTVKFVSGFKTDTDAFVRNLDGTVSYNGDRGVHTVQVSENFNVATGSDGESVFGRVETDDGRKHFEIVEGLMGSITRCVKSMKATAMEVPE